ncbi:hypothetical protein AC579_5020 [Pseudocercospora musae]|uniref:Uncharacterized protein n=1 Tax=Pseudocercospora musae TaxID=113226 RepID=A0A139I8Q3_9PEZI|nr:hypothetical protein AC579_5020 [Pseudocercospora musae]
MNVPHPTESAASGAMVTRSVTDQDALIGTSAVYQFAATIFGLMNDAPEQWARQVALSQEAPNTQMPEELLVTSPHLKARSSTAGSAHDSGYGPLLESDPFELDVGLSSDADLAHDLLAPKSLHENDEDVVNDHDTGASMLSVSINERGYSGVGRRPQTASGRLSKTSDSRPLSTSAALRSRIKHGSDRISACISDFCRPPTDYRSLSSSASSLSLRGMLDSFPAPPPSSQLSASGGTLPAMEKSQDKTHVCESPPTATKLPIRPSTRSSIKGIFKNIKQRLSTREAMEHARQSTHRGSVMERGSVIVTPYDVVEWRQNGRSVRYLLSPRLMREGMLLASQTSLM